MTRIPAPNSATDRAPAWTVRERQPDDRLVELARLGDERAFEVLIERHRPLLLAHCRERLAAFKAPKTLYIVDTIPKTATGKLQRQRLPALLGLQ